MGWVSTTTKLSHAYMEGMRCGGKCARHLHVGGVGKGSECVCVVCGRNSLAQKIVLRHKHSPASPDQPIDG